MTNKQLAKQLHEIGNSLFDKNYDPNMKLLLDEAGDRLETQSEWISVEERLPDNGNAVLVNRYNKRLKFSVANIDNYQGYGKWWDKDYDGTVWTITHWMPLPETPKMKGGAE